MFSNTDPAILEILNASDHAKVYYCRHMLPGIAGYEIADKATGKIKTDNLYIDTDCMKRSAPSFVGKPIFVYHKTGVPINEIEDTADGYVTECFYNPLDGWLWAKMLVVSDEAQQAIKRKWSVSNAYLPKTWDGAGQHLSLDYDRKLSDYAFTHLAIVPNPRYENAKVYTPEEYKAYNEELQSQLDELHNSKPEPKGTIMFFRTKKEEVKAGDIQDTDFVEIKNDDGSTTTVTVAELKAAKLEENKALAAEAEKLNSKAKKNEKEIEDSDEIEVDGEKVNMAALKTCYTNSKKMKKNADDEAKAAAEAEEKKNAEEAEKKKAADEAEKENAAKRMKEITNAHTKKTVAPVVVHTMQSGLSLGKSRYGFDSK